MASNNEDAENASRDAAFWRRRSESLEDALVHMLTYGGPCPCGARIESPQTHPHAIGCPVGMVLDRPYPSPERP